MDIHRDTFPELPDRVNNADVDYTCQEYRTIFVKVNPVNNLHYVFPNTEMLKNNNIKAFRALGCNRK